MNRMYRVCVISAVLATIATHSALGYENALDTVSAGGGRTTGAVYENFASVGGFVSSTFLSSGEVILYPGFIFASEVLDFTEVAQAMQFPVFYSPGLEAEGVCELSYATNQMLLSLLARVNLPPGWSITSVSGDGGPLLFGNEILFLGNLTVNPVQFSYFVSVPPGESGVKEITAEVEYHFAGRSDPIMIYAAPNPVLAVGYDDIPMISDTSASGSEYSFSWNSVSGVNYTVETATNLQSGWTPLIGWVDVPGIDGLMLVTGSLSGGEELFFRVSMHK